jgi:hypothetical protein
MLAGRDDEHRLKSENGRNKREFLGKLCIPKRIRMPGKRHAYPLGWWNHQSRLNDRTRFTPAIHDGPDVPAVLAWFELAGAAVEAPTSRNQDFRLRRFVAEDKRRSLEQLDVVAGCARDRWPSEAPCAGSGRGRTCSSRRLVRTLCSPGPHGRGLRLRDRRERNGRGGLAVRPAADEECRAGEDDQHPSPGHHAASPSTRPAFTCRGCGQRPRSSGFECLERVRRFGEPLASPLAESRVDERELGTDGCGFARHGQAVMKSSATKSDVVTRC